MYLPKILFFSRDPGATNVLMAVYDALTEAYPSQPPHRAFKRLATSITRGSAPKTVIYGKNGALDMWLSSGYSAKNWLKAIDCQSNQLENDAAIKKLLQEQKFTAVISGTSDIDEDTDCNLWRIARAVGIPSHVFLDRLSNLDKRFVGVDRELIFPDFVYVPNAEYIKPLLDQGIPTECICVVGELQTERMRRIGARVRPAEVLDLRDQWGANTQKRVVLFVSECAAEMALLGRPSPYNEFEILDRVIADINANRLLGDQQISTDNTLLLIRPHPRDSKDKYDKYMVSGSPHIIVSCDGTPAQAILAADIVIGMDSTLLFEASVLGRRTVSLISSSSFSKYIAGKEKYK